MKKTNRSENVEEIELLEEQENKDYLAKLLEVLKESTKENSIIV